VAMGVGVGVDGFKGRTVIYSHRGCCAHGCGRLQRGK
jgi:hypothetical protein